MTETMDKEKLRRRVICPPLQIFLVTVQRIKTPMSIKVKNDRERQGADRNDVGSPNAPLRRMPT
jgi:hypothetical protein